jgi:hypothetical protein
LRSYRISACAAVMTISALAACGGGASTTPPAPSTVATSPPASASSTPTATTAPPSARPFNDGDVFSFSGGATQTIARVLPAPQPTSQVTQTITQSVKVASKASFAGHGNLYALTSTETDVGGLKTTNSTTQAYYGLVSGANGAQNLAEYGYTWKDLDGFALSYTYPVPQVVDVLPETAGASWTNDASASIVEDDADGTHSERTYVTDGSYTEQTTFPNGSLFPGNATPAPAVITENADGGGDYRANFTGFFYDVQVGAPHPDSNGNAVADVNICQYVHAFTTSGVASPTPSPTDPPATCNDGGTIPSPPIQSLTIPAFAGLKPALYSETDTNSGLKPIPAACNVPATIGASGNDLVQDVKRIDTVLGYIDEQITNSYIVPGFGVACVVMKDVQTSYYDYNGTTATQGNFGYFSGKPFQTTTLDQTIGLQKATVGGITTQSASRQSSATPVASGEVSVARARLQAVLDRWRLQRTRSMGPFLRRLSDRARSGGAR